MNDSSLVGSPSRPLQNVNLLARDAVRLAARDRV